MAEIQNQLDRISSAIYGRDVRSSIHDAIAAINGDVEGCVEGEKGREEAERARVKAESERASADESRTKAEAARASAEEARAQGMKDMEGRISGLMAATGAERVHLCVEGEYSDAADDSPPVPAVEDPKTQVVYLTPVKGAAEHGGYAAWLYVDGKWEALGGGLPSSPLAVADGGTGAADAEGARSSLSVYSKEEVDALIEKATKAEATGTPIESGTSFSNAIAATVSAIEAGGLMSWVTLTVGGRYKAYAFVPNTWLSQAGAKAGSLVIMAFDESDVCVLASATVSPTYSENLWDGSVPDSGGSIESDGLYSRVRLNALGTEVFAMISKGKMGSMGIEPLTTLKIAVSPFDIHILPFTRDHTGGTSTPDPPSRDHAGGSN